ncbi:hypothetical protein ANCDUO_19326, partial [Ancylostoma duodenale]
MGSYKALSEEKTRENDKLIIKVDKLEHELATAKDRLAAAETRVEGLVQEKLLLENKIAHESPIVAKHRNPIDYIAIFEEKKTRLESQVIETETEMELLKGKIDSLSQENEDLKSKVGQIRPFEDEFRRLRDEVEELRVKEADHSKLQQAYEQLKNKAKDSSNDRAELLVLREKVKSYVEHGMLLEDEQRKNKTLRTQMGSYKALSEEKTRENDKLIIKVDK